MIRKIITVSSTKKVAKHRNDGVKFKRESVSKVCLICLTHIQYSISGQIFDEDLLGTLFS